jgi:hypothetical protein
VDAETETTPAPLTAGYAEMRNLGGGHGYFYFISCDHGTTQLHEVEGADPRDVTVKLIGEHHERLGCRCQRA